MARIYLEVFIEAPVERVFDLSRSIYLHMRSASQTNEKAVSGKTSGLIGLNETVTWRARHFGIYQHLTVKITDFQRPFSFTDVMLKGAFASMNHRHIFEAQGSGTKMTDVFEFSSPFGWIGRAVDFIYLKEYMKQFLIIRNNEIKRVAESDAWQKFLIN